MQALKHTLVVSVIFAALAATVGCGRAGDIYQFRPPGIYQILGKVVNQTGEPVPNAPVLLANTPNTSRIIITMTDEKGNYTFTGLKDETYKVVPQKEGAEFYPASRTVSLTQNSRRQELNFRVAP